MIRATKVFEGTEGRTWIITDDGTVMLANPKDQTGLQGDVVTFKVGEASFQVKGPWCSNQDAMWIDVTRFSKQGRNRG